MEKRMYDSLRRVNQALFQRSFYYIFRGLSDEEAGQLVKAVFATWASKAKKAKRPENIKIYPEYREIMRELDAAAERYLEKAGRWLEVDEIDPDEDEDEEI